LALQQFSKLLIAALRNLSHTLNTGVGTAQWHNQATAGSVQDIRGLLWDLVQHLASQADSLPEQAM
jgi:hypothetical protein